MDNHRHASKSASEDRCFFHPVFFEPFTSENKAAHGGVTYTETCDCGAVRYVNQNGGFVEYGPWHA